MSSRFFIRRAVELVASLKPPKGGRTSLFTAVDTMHVPSQALVPPGTRAAVTAEVRRINKERLASAHRALDAATRTLTRAGWKVDRVVTTGAPLRELLSTVAKKRADVAVVGARGVSGVRHLLLGSVAEGALNRCPVPVLIAR
jgi:nucleotide-binding universal stress UspA family protein